jgi:hypothetical protein
MKWTYGLAGRWLKIFCENIGGLVFPVHLRDMAKKTTQNRRPIFILAGALIVIVLLVGLTPAVRNRILHPVASARYSHDIGLLNHAFGASHVKIGNISTVPGTAPLGSSLLVTVNKTQRIHIWQYRSAKTTAAKIELIKPVDGHVKDAHSIVDYFAPLHWYQQNQSLVFYVGNDPGTLAKLQKTYGKPFYGSTVIID